MASTFDDVHLKMEDAGPLRVAAAKFMHLHKVHAELEGIAGILHRHFGFWFCFSLTRVPFRIGPF